MMTGPLMAGLVFSLALVFASRLPWKASLGALAVSSGLCILSAFVAAPRSAIGTWLYGVPFSMLLTWLGVWVSKSWTNRDKFRALVGFAAAGWVLLMLTRVEGRDGYFWPTFSWRWTQTREARLLEEVNATPHLSLRDSTSDSAAMHWEVVAEEWPSFRGPSHNSHVRDDLSKLNWTNGLPREVWRSQVGPSWSSMCIVSGRLFTQEQRGREEVLSCYDASTGEPIWRYREESRFEEINSGAGPRATPSYSAGRVFGYGARGILVAVDASTGKRLWRRDLMREVGAPLPIWGFQIHPPSSATGSSCTQVGAVRMDSWPSIAMTEACGGRLRRPG
ncbi:MAG: PQQ-binding-like beta-propeller repeat protein [Planctomycetota bacterium]